MPNTYRRNNCYVWTFWPGQKCHSRWCTGRKGHILVAVMRGNRVGGNWLMKWDELKKFPWYITEWCTGREWPGNCITVISSWWRFKHSISKIEWASNDYITQLSSTSQLNWVPVPVEFNAQGASGVASRVPDSWRRDVVGKTTPDRGGPREPRWSLGFREDADKMQ